MKNEFYIKQTPSTNQLIWEMNREKELPEGFVISTDFQLAGKGQPGNTWESSEGKNILFSLMLRPIQLPMEELFLLSQLVSIAIKNALEDYVSNITVKWPNDIYWNDRKLAGILIENSLQGNKIKMVVIGVGLNVNQQVFKSDAPNPVSLMQITGKRKNRKLILKQIVKNILNLYSEMNKEKIRSQYYRSLYRNDGYYFFKDEMDSFKAKIHAVHPDGQLELEKETGERKSYYFKEVQYILPANQINVTEK
jgi:BirA family biotin operon repressor/biotin-[acetyl-CoA-carboxylase] ligase